MKLKHALPLGLVLAALAPAAAQAADREGTITAVGGTFAWTGLDLTGASVTGDVTDATGCLPMQCDDTLLHVKTAGDLTVKIGEAAATASDLDLYLFATNANGTATDSLGSSAGGTAEEMIVKKGLDPGNYLVHVVAAVALMGNYKGTATLAAPTGPTGATGASGTTGAAVSAVDTPVAATPPDSAPAGPAGPSGAAGTTTTGGTGQAGSTGVTTKAKNTAPRTFFSARRPVKAGKGLVLKGTSSDDGKLKRVRVGLVRVKGSKCSGLTAKGAFKPVASCKAPVLLTASGTTAWTLRVPKLAKGSYVAYAKATDAAGLSGRSSKVTFKVK